MALNPRMVTRDIEVSWGGGLTRVLRGTVVDIPPGSALEDAYGTDNLVDLSPQDETNFSWAASPVSPEGGSG